MTQDIQSNALEVSPPVWQYVISYLEILTVQQKLAKVGNVLSCSFQPLSLAEIDVLKAFVK